MTTSTKENKRTNWHRLLGLILHPLFNRMGYDTSVEMDLSFKTQRADIITVRRQAQDQIVPDLPLNFWQVFDNLNEHNIITFKSYSEVFNAYALEELYGHLINYGKVKEVELELVNLYAIVHYYPRDLLTPFLEAGLVKVVQAGAVYDLGLGSLKPVRIIVCRTIENPLLALFSEDYDKVKQSYERIEQESNLVDEVSSYLYRIKEYFGEVMKTMYTKEDFWRENPVPWEEKVREEAFEEGREEGREEGERKALVLTTQRVTVLRFGVELDHFEEVLQDLPFTGVKHLSDMVFDVDTLDEFEEAIKEVQAQYPGETWNLIIK